MTFHGPEGNAKGNPAGDACGRAPPTRGRRSGEGHVAVVPPTAAVARPAGRHYHLGDGGTMALDLQPPPISIPLTTDAAGVIRIAGTRVTLDSVIAPSSTRARRRRRSSRSYRACGSATSTS